MKLSNVKAVAAKLMTVGLFAGALALMAPKAQAQQFFVGAQFGRPVYGGGPGGYFARQRWQQEQFARHEAWVRHERWERGYFPPPPPPRYWR